MGARTGTALGGLQFFLRAVQFCCAALVLAIFSYFLATLSNHNLPIATWIRGVEGIAGSAVLYTALSVLTLCCCGVGAGSSRLAMLAGLVLDVCFAGAFIYVATANRAGAGSCVGPVDTPFGAGDTATDRVPDSNGGFTVLPSLRQACQMQSACLAVAIIAVFMFVFSVLAELALIRHHRKERRFGPGPANDYTSGYGRKTGGLLGLLGFGRRKGDHDAIGAGVDPNTLPEHTHPDDVRDSYASEQTRVGTANGVVDPKYNSLAYSSYDIGGAPAVGTGTGYGQHHEAVPLAQYPPGNYRYDDGVYDRTAETRF